MTIKQLQFLALAAALSLAALPVPAQEEAHSTGGVTIGGQGGSGLDESSKLQQFETVPEGVFVPKAWYSWTKGEYFVDVKVKKPGLDDQFASLVTGQKKKFKLDLSWDQNPNWQSNTARTPFTEVSPGVFKLPDGLQLALQNTYVPWVTPTTTNPIGTGSAPRDPTVPGFFAVESWVQESAPIDLRYLRKTGRAGLTVNAGKYTNLKVNYSREMRDGNKNTTFYGGPDFEVATPIAYQTDDIRLEADFARGRWFANASASFSKFANDVAYALIDNPERLQLSNPANGRFVINDSDSFRLWLPPDNDANSFDFTAGRTFPKRHKLTAAFSTGRMSMDTPLLALSTNPNLATSATAPNANFSVVPPYSDVSARFDHFMGQVKFTGDPHAKFGYILSWRKFELSDKTDEYTFHSTVRGDVGPSYSVEGNSRVPEGYDVQSLRAELHVLPARGFRLSASLGEDKHTYDRREFVDVKDDVWTFTADYNRDWVNLHGAWTLLDRKPGDVNIDSIQPTWQGATQTDITERKRHNLSGIVTLLPNSKIQIALNGAKQDNEFAESVTGLLDQTSSQLGVDIVVVPNERVNLVAGYVYEKYFFDMAAAYFPRGVAMPPNFDPRNDPNYWSNATEDKVDTFRVGLDWVIKPQRWDLSANLNYTKPRSDSQYTFVPGGTGEANGVWPATPVAGFPTAAVAVPTTFDSFPLVTKKFYIAKVQLSYHIEKNLTASVLYWKQKYDNVDWQTETQPYMGRIDPGSNRWFFLGARIPSYDADILRASLTYTF